MEKKSPFVAQRLSDNRTVKGKENTGAPMTQQEKQENMMLIIQVPLKRRQVSTTVEVPFKKSVRSYKNPVNVEEAVIKIGEPEGKFEDTSFLDIERDPSYPVRLTLQYYKTTDNGEIDENVMNEISTQLKDARQNADSIGSLVVGNVSRPTESKREPKPPKWWSEFWLTYRADCNHTEKEAIQMVFEGGRYENSTRSEAEKAVLQILGIPPPVEWNLL